MSALQTIGQTAQRWWSSPRGRPLIILGVTLVVAAGVFIVNTLNGPSLDTQTYKYRNGAINFSFDYPTSFTDHKDSLKQQSDTSQGFIAQQGKQNKDGSIEGYIRLTYQPLPAATDVSNLLTMATKAINHGNAASVKAFTSYPAIANAADCSKYAIITTVNDKPLLKCNLPSGYAKLKLKGAILFGANKAGLYEFSFFIGNTFWDQHTDVWNGLYKAIDYN